MSLTSITPELFEQLYEQFVVAHAKRLATIPTKRKKTPRQRASGAGWPHVAHDLHTCLLMTVVSLRIYPTVAVFGFLFGLHKTNAVLTIRDVLTTLDHSTIFVCERPASTRRQLRSLQAVMDALPNVRLIIDAKEQRV